MYVYYTSPYSFIHIHIDTHTRTYIHTYMHACMDTYIHTCIHTYIRAYVHACMHTYIHTYIHTWVVHLYTYIYIYMYTYTYMSWLIWPPSVIPFGPARLERCTARCARCGFIAARLNHTAMARLHTVDDRNPAWLYYNKTLGIMKVKCIFGDAGFISSTVGLLLLDGNTGFHIGITFRPLKRVSGIWPHVPNELQ